MLIFSEYRTTQSYLKEALEGRFGAGCVELINGSMHHRLRREAIAHFEESAQFLISTEAGGEGIDRTQQRIAEALARAKAAARKQHVLFEHAASFDPNETRNELRITADHGETFVTGMFRLLSIEIVETSHNGRLWHLRLPEAVQAALGVTRGRYEVTLDRILAVNRPNTHMLDLDSFMMQYLLQQAKSHDFGGLSAVIRGSPPDTAAVLTSLLRWQSDQGQRRRQEYTAFSVGDGGEVQVNPAAFGEWLKQPHTQEAVQRPDVGVQPELAARKGAKTYRYDSSLAPELC